MGLCDLLSTSMYRSRLVRAYYCSLALWTHRQTTAFVPSSHSVRTLRRTMSSTDTDVAHNLRLVQDNITKAATAPVRLVAVSKTKPLELLQQAYDAGCRVFGENYVQELVEKAPAMPDDVQWHFIGALQSNKANKLVSACPPERLTVETVSSTKLANKLHSAVDGIPGQRLKVMVQVNTSGEDSKSGVEPGKECVELCRHIVTECPHLQLTGLMTIGAPGDLSCFQVLQDCRTAVQEALDLVDLELSMGMSGDYLEAIAAGATNVRVGSTIFGARQYPPKND